MDELLEGIGCICIHLGLQSSIFTWRGWGAFNFCRWLLQGLDNNAHSFKIILWCNESTFTEICMINTSYNVHEWKNKSRHLIYNRSYQRLWSINVWAVLLNNNVIRPSVLPNPLSDVFYSNCKMNINQNDYSIKFP